MSIAVQQFLQIVRETWAQKLYCEHCARETQHTGCVSGRNEYYVCQVCHWQKVYAVR